MSAPSVLRRAIRRAERSGEAARNVAELAELPAAETRKSQALTEAQVRHRGVRDHYRRLCLRAGIGGDWQLRETRHTFISQLSDSGVDIEKIADAAGHINSNVTRTVYRHQLADEVSSAAEAMDRLIGKSR
jgi:integrase